MIPRVVEVPTVEKPICLNAMADRASKLKPFCRILDKVFTVLQKYRLQSANHQPAIIMVVDKLAHRNWRNATRHNPAKLSVT
jgi:hypothetical protein